MTAPFGNTPQHGNNQPGAAQNNPFSAAGQGQPAAPQFNAPAYQQQPPVTAYHAPMPVQQNYGAPQSFAPQMGAPAGYQQKSWVVTLLLNFFLWEFSAHNFYKGFTTRAVIQLAMFWGGALLMLIPLVGWVAGGALWTAAYVWVFIEFMMTLFGAQSMNVDANGVPLRK
ncbi:NINE protein [Corynebacterium flavescens]|uniref:TM2 domain-containing protein n=1 Tax=Corynebacterium flavescens TaxID=28028 RepID=A0AB73BAL4_CORFL|nr:TM2 domain-containing protein [Corynebacterium flavescens]MDN6100122.1 NINE protein [Corynebacterium flavescens]MDN6200350.1 NINE protein [Corynebacterium flavescens]MDN6226916.1 NINE protein [Corynebacterium flavescens]MDN6431902.1 NINE protein [Corynebacterium flavescens]MDN6532043.1 NINE protein [Corynebacterium flavescens]